MELASFLRTHNKYIYKWNNLTENYGCWQKDSCTSKAVRKIHTGLGRRRGEAIRLGSVPWEGTQMRKGVTQAEIFPGERVIRPT